MLHCVTQNQNKFLTNALLEQVHVLDVCQALWHVTTAGNDGEIYNLVDKNDTSKCSMYSLLLPVYLH